MTTLLIAHAAVSVVVLFLHGLHIHDLRRRMEWQEGMPTTRKPRAKKRGRR